MATLAGEYARVTGPHSGLAGDTKTWFGRYNFGTTVVVAANLHTLMKLPGKILVVGGEMWAGDLDTGTETLDIDLGWAANGGGSVTYTHSESGFVFTNSGASASATGFFNSGLWSGDGVTDIIAAGINYRPIPMITGPLYFSHPTQVQFSIVAAAATPANAQAWAFLRYIAL